MFFLKTFKEYLTEETKGRVVAVYPGRFQMPHQGHKHVYDFLRQKFGHCFISTSNKVDGAKSPFNFQEKQQLLSFMGIPSGDIIQTTIPYNDKNILNKLGKNDILVFGVGGKEMKAGSERFHFGKTKDGKDSYFQPYTESTKLEPHTKHAYIITVPTHTFSVMGLNASSASEMRSRFKGLSPVKQKVFIQDLYGKYSATIHNLLIRKIGNANTPQNPIGLQK